MVELDQKLIENLTKSIEGLTKTVQKSRQAEELQAKRVRQQVPPPQRRSYNTTRFTTPDVGGFRGFFGPAPGEELIQDVEQVGFRTAVTEKFKGALGISQAEQIERERSAATGQLADATEELKSLEDNLMVLMRKGIPMPPELEQKLQVAGAEQQIALEQFEETQKRTELKEGANAVRVMRNMIIGFSVATAAVLKFRDSIIEAGQALGGVDISQALRNRIETIFTSIQSIFTGQFVGFGQMERIQGSLAGEFGQLVNVDEALRIGRVQQRLGITIDEFTKLQRALQGTGMDVEDTVDEFREVGIVGRVAAREIAKNADAVARAGDQFNRFIRDGIANAKRLGLEFSEIEDTLTGISTDFEGTVGNFSQLRAVLPGFSADFGQLFTTALYGTTDEFIEQIRTSLEGAGVTDISQLNRTQVAMLEQATGFGAAELQRILENEEVFQDKTLALDQQRNSILNKLGIAITAGIGAIVGAVIGSSIVGILGGGLIGAGLGTAIGAGVGGLAGTFGGAAAVGGFNDFVFRPGQPPAKFSSKDTIIGTKTPEKLGTSVVDNTNLESKIDQLVMATRDQTNALTRGMVMEVRDIDKAIVRRREAAIRNS